MKLCLTSPPGMTFMGLKTPVSFLLTALFWAVSKRNTLAIMYVYIMTPANFSFGQFIILSLRLYCMRVTDMNACGKLIVNSLLFIITLFGLAHVNAHDY